MREAHSHIFISKVNQTLRCGKMEELISSYLMRIEGTVKEFKANMESLLAELEKQRGSIAFPLLFGVTSEIACTTTDYVYDALHKLGLPIEENVDVILFSSGGDPTQSYLIADMLQKNIKGKLTFIIPRYAKSAATLLACAGDSIIMGPPSELGPVELVIKARNGTWISARSIIDTLRILSNRGISSDVIKEAVGLGQIPVAEIGDHTKSMEYITSVLEKVLSARMFKDKPEQARSVARALTEIRVHDAVITKSDAIQIGLRIEAVPKEVWDIAWNIHKEWSKVLSAELLLSQSRLMDAGYHLVEQTYPLGKGLIFTAKPFKISSET
jgi:hypothetical protein